MLSNIRFGPKFTFYRPILAGSLPPSEHLRDLHETFKRDIPKDMLNKLFTSPEAKADFLKLHEQVKGMDISGHVQEKFGARPTLRDYCFWFNKRLRDGLITQRDFQIAETTAKAIVAMKILPLKHALKDAEEAGKPLEVRKRIFDDILEYVVAVQALSAREPPPLFADAVRQRGVAAARRDIKLLKRTGAIKQG